MQPLIPERLQTDRMVGERLTHDHEAEMARLLLDPRVEATLWPFDRRQTAGDVQEGLARQLDLWRCHGFGLWLLRDRATLGCVGRGGLEYTDAPGTVAVEVAWTIAPDRWGEGLATELARAAVHVAFAKLDVPGLRQARRARAGGADPARQPRVAAGDGEGRLRLRARHRPRWPAARPVPA
jgi:RimJ/RimL family protein N-acetyltransferase